MGISLLLITHNDIGSSLLDCAAKMLGTLPIHCKSLAITAQMDIEQGYSAARRLCTDFNSNDDLLIITDMYGSTPSNIAAKLLSFSEHKNAQQHKLILTGVNLPMLVKIMNYSHLNLNALAEEACTGASESIFIVEHSIDCP